MSLRSFSLALILASRRLGGGGVHVQVVVQVAFQYVQNVGLQQGAVVGAVGLVGFEVCAAELGLGLCFEDGFLYAHAEGADQALAYDLGGVVLLDEVLHHAGVGFAEGALVGAALGGVLAVDEGEVVVVALAVDVGEGGLEVAVFDVDDGVERVALEVVLQQVEQAVLGVVAALVVVHGEAAVEVAVVPDALLDVFADEVVVAEELVVGDELHQGAAFGGGVADDAAVVGELALGEFGAARLAFAEGLHLEVGGEGVDGLGTHAVQADRLLEHLAVVLGAGVQFADGFDQLAQRYAAAVVADANVAFAEVDFDFDLLAVARGELVDGVVYNLFDENVDAVVVARAVAQFADVHTRTQADVLHVLKVDDGVVVVVGLGVLFSRMSSSIGSVSLFSFQR